MILGTVIALLVVIMIMAPRKHDPLSSDITCPRCGRDFDDEPPTVPHG